MPQYIPLSRLARLTGKPRSVLQQLAREGKLHTFDGQVDLDEALRLFPDMQLEDDTELRRMQEIKEQALGKQPMRMEMGETGVLHERLRQLGREYAAAQGKLLHYDRVLGWLGDRLAEGVEKRHVEQHFATDFMQWLRRELAAPHDDIRRWQELLARERIMRVMTAQVTVLPKQLQFEVIGEETILEAGLRAGIALPYGCSNGTCGDCKCRLVSGEVARVRPHDYSIPAMERAQGYTLACSYAPVGDVAIEVPVWSAHDIPEQTIATKVRTSEQLGPDRFAIHLLTPRAERLRYMAGQWLEITIEGESRMVPAASCPCEERRIEVHLLCDRGGRLESRIRAGLKPGDDVRVRGPFGDFVLDDTSSRPLLLLASGSGFSPIKSVLQHALSLDHAPSITLYRIAGADGFYQENLVKSYAAALDQLRYFPCHADQGTRAAIADCLARIENLSAYDVYAAGPGPFLAEARQACAAAGLPDDCWRAAEID